MKPSKEKEAPVKFTIYLSDETRRALRIRAIQEGVSATKLVERLIGEYLEGQSARRGGDR
jgi:hypothetical protein